MVQPWRLRLDSLGLSKEEIGQVVNLILELPPGDREDAVDLDPEVALASLKDRMFKSGERGLEGQKPSKCLPLHVPSSGLRTTTLHLHSLWHPLPIPT